MTVNLKLMRILGEQSWNARGLGNGDGTPNEAMTMLYGFSAITSAAHDVYLESPGDQTHSVFGSVVESHLKAAVILGQENSGLDGILSHLTTNIDLMACAKQASLWLDTRFESFPELHDTLAEAVIQSVYEFVMNGDEKLKGEEDQREWDGCMTMALMIGFNTGRLQALGVLHGVLAEHGIDVHDLLNPARRK